MEGHELTEQKIIYDIVNIIGTWQRCYCGDKVCTEEVLLWKQKWQLKQQVNTYIYRRDIKS